MVLQNVQSRRLSNEQRAVIYLLLGQQPIETKAQGQSLCGVGKGADEQLWRKI